MSWIQEPWLLCFDWSSYFQIINKKTRSIVPLQATLRLQSASQVILLCHYNSRRHHKFQPNTEIVQFTDYQFHLINFKHVVQKGLEQFAWVHHILMEWTFPWTHLSLLLQDKKVLFPARLPTDTGFLDLVCIFFHSFDAHHFSSSLLFCQADKVQVSSVSSP